MLFSVWGHQANKRKKEKTKEKNKRKTDTRKKKKIQSHRPNTSLEATQGTTKTIGQPLANHWSISCPCYTVYWPADSAAPHSSDERQAQSMMPKIEIHWYPQTSAKTKSLTQMTTAEKAVKEKDCTQMPVAKKERTGHKCLWQRKKDQTQMMVANEKWLP